MIQTLVEVEQVSVDYHTRAGTTVQALSDFDLTISEGEFVSIVGPSGCGKSSLLRLLSGLQVPTSGSVRYRGQPMTGPRPLEMAFVFQDFALLPWRTVLANTEFGLEMRKVPRAERRDIARRELERVGIAEFAESYPRELSGGMQQRVGIARALAMGTELVLMDEPFGSLDEQTREAIGEEVARILTEVGKTCVLVTHSIGEAILLSDRIIVVSGAPGRVLAEVDVPGSRPRAADFMAEDAFVKMRGLIYRMLHGSSRTSSANNSAIVAPGGAR
ncbi:MAG: ABC transporter ATP-binding protein [Acidimicrobiales bacterium]